VRIGKGFKPTGKESVEELHQRARAAGYDFVGVPRWTGKSWDVGTVTHLPKGNAPPGSGPPSTGAGPQADKPPAEEGGSVAGGSAGKSGPGGGEATSGKTGHEGQGERPGEAPAEREGEKKELTELDYAVKLAGITQFETEEDPEGVSGGIPGGMGPKENASRWGQFAYLGLALFDVVNVAKLAWSAGKSLVKRGISAIGRRFGRKAATKSAFEIAREGGRHAGFLRNYAGKPPAEVRKGIRGLEKQIAEHEAKIADPEKAISGFRKLDPRQQRALIEKKWPSDIQRQREQLEILQGILGGR
jgi:hypothetical protein